MNISFEFSRLLGGAGIAVFAASAIASACLVLLLRPVLKRYTLAMPNARSSHRIPTPQGGGMAVIAAVIGSVIVIMGAAGALTPDVVALLAPLFLAIVFIAVVGGVDDIRSIAIVPRLMLQALAVCLMIVSLPTELRVIQALPWWIERALMLIACVWFVNLSNFMDGIDWMTVAEVVPVTIGLVLIGLVGGLPSYAVIVSLALCGAMIGFAPFNRPVARLFLGDVGSLPIGLLLSWLLVLLAGEGHLIAALLLPLFYVTDATVTLLWRIVNGERFWEAHRSHFYQQALVKGFNSVEVVSHVLIVNVVLVALAITTVLRFGTIMNFLAFAIGVALVSALLYSFTRDKNRAH